MRNYNHYVGLETIYEPITDLNKDNEFEAIMIPSNKEIETIYDDYVDECYKELNFN